MTPSQTKSSTGKMSTTTVHFLMVLFPEPARMELFGDETSSEFISESITRRVEKVFVFFCFFFWGGGGGGGVVSHPH